MYMIWVHRKHWKPRLLSAVKKYSNFSQQPWHKFDEACKDTQYWLRASVKRQASGKCLHCCRYMVLVAATVRAHEIDNACCCFDVLDSCCSLLQQLKPPAQEPDFVCIATRKSSPCFRMKNVCNVLAGFFSSNKPQNSNYLRHKMVANILILCSYVQAF